MSINFLKKSRKKGSRGSEFVAEPVVAMDEGPIIEEPAIYEEPSVGFSTSESSTKYDGLARKILYWTVFLIPLFFLPFTSSVLEFNKYILLLVVAGVGMVLWLLNVVISGHLNWRTSYLDKGILGVLVATVITSIFSVSRFKSVFGTPGSLSDSLASVIALTIVYFLILNFSDDRGHKVKNLLNISLILVLLQAVLQMFGINLFWFSFAKDPAFNLVGSINVVGVIAAIVLPMFYKNNIYIFKYLNIAKLGLALALWILIVLNWWVLWLIAIAGMAAIIVFENLKPRLSEGDYSLKISNFLFPMAVIVVAAFLTIVSVDFSYIKKNLPIEVAPSFGLSGKVMSSVFQHHLVTGVGPENFSLAFDKYGAGQLRNTTLSSIRFTDATSQFFNFVTQGGLLMLLAIGYLFYLLITYFGKSRYMELNREEVGVFSALAASLTAFFLYPFNLSLMFLWYVLLALAGIIWADEKKYYDVEQDPSLSLVSSLSFIGGLILALVGLYFGTTLYFSDTFYAKALTEKDSQKGINYLSRAIRWNSEDDRLYRSASQAALSLLGQELNRKADPGDSKKTSRMQGYISSAVNFGQKAIQLEPQETNNWINLGTVYQSLIQLNIDGVEKMAENAYLEGLKLRPGDPNFNQQIGAGYLAKADFSRQLAFQSGANGSKFARDAGEALARAEDNFKKAIDLSSNFGLAIYDLGVVYDWQGRLGDSIKQLEKLAPFNSNQPNLAFELGLLYYRAGQKDKAFKQLERAVVLSPNFSNAHWYLALINEERGDRAAAISHLEKILDVAENKDNKIVLDKLNQLRSGKTTNKKVLDEKPL